MVSSVPPPQELERRFGSSSEMQESAAWIISGAGGSSTSWNLTPAAVKLQAATQVASCRYEAGTCWGRETGWVYGTSAEDILTGVRIHGKGWRSVSFDPEPPAFLGCVPLSGPVTMTQHRRWATGLLEMLLHRDGLLSTSLAGKLALRPCLAYALYGSWGLRSAPELCYALLAPYCAFKDAAFLPKASEPTFVIPALLAVFYNAYTLAEYLDCDLSVRTWWNNQRMHRIKWTTAALFGSLDVVSKLVGLSETTFEVTAKEQTAAAATPEAAAAAAEPVDVNDPGRFTFDSSPVYVPGTALVLLNSAAAAAILSKLLIIRSPAGRAIQSGDGPGIAELVCSVWVVISFWPFVKGLFGSGSYGIPWSTLLKGSLLSSLFLAFCNWSS